MYGIVWFHVKVKTEMDYQEEYIKKNPSLDLDQSELKANQILLFIGKMNVSSLLDIACGAGGITNILLEKLKTKKTAGLDISKEMIRVAKLNDKKKKIVWLCQNIFDYHSKKRFDLVTCIDIIEHIEDDLKFLKKVATLGNKVLIKVPMEDSILDNKIMRKLKIRDYWKESEIKYGHIHHYNETDLLKLFDKAGFKILKQGYINLPKRSLLFYEVLRVIFLPIGWFSQKAMANFVGGFMIALLEPKNITTNKQS